MSKRPSSKQIEMLLPISGKKAESAPVVKKTRQLSYQKIVDSLRKKGLTKTAVKK
ncbi:hypothetical protein OGR47_11440 [Methylocystis sp. MJC1]|uniref:hypothetical protein n=1 Tax=Methylocystis sp. MJC1 TaxID=2654282 RepID=UPI0013EC0487|nr:hypothetical protein [Methylocystis sp. MJC1]KAF2990154.1 hypothetical protein MJC1_02814 [Methylocystis sp. MJC1]MBU6527595.1 hypothetical protein [Methylocystis sp. MJC1]UZX10534.1 hypothetical protein OGR47_11440 [Methylocystis sp. MJC1]